MSVTGDIDLRVENFESMVKGFALREFKMKQLVMVQTSNSWIESYYRETYTDLTQGIPSAGTANAVQGIPRLACFPYGEVIWVKVQAMIQKYGMEGVISWEDAMTDAIDVIARTLLRISRAVAFAVDTQIYTVLEAAAGNTLAITATYEWDSVTIANRQPIQNILQAKQKLQEKYFDPDTNDTYLCLSPKDYANLLGNSLVMQNPNFHSRDVVEDGVVATICGCKIIVSPTVTTDKALMVIAKECGTWKEAAPLTVYTDVDKGIKYTIRAFCMGVCQCTTPMAVVSITNTQA